MGLFTLSNGFGPKDIFRKTFRAVYPAVGYDNVNNTYDGHYVGEVNAESYLDHPVTWITTFLGLPNRKMGLTPSVKSIVYNFIGWQENVERERQIFNIVKAFVLIPWHLISIVPRLAVNCVKLVTEFLPALITEFFKFFAQKFAEKAQSASIVAELSDSFADRALKNTYTGLGYTFQFLYVLSSAAKFALRAVSSPITNVKLSWNKGGEFGATVANWLGLKGNFKTGLTIAGSLLLSAASTLITMSAYSVLVPYVGGALLGKFMPFVTQNFPITWLIKGYRMMKDLGHFGLAVFPPLAQLAPAFGLTPAYMTLGAIVGLAFPTIGTGLSVAISKFTNWYSRSAQKAPLADVGEEFENAGEKINDSLDSTAGLMKGLGKTIKSSVEDFNLSDAFKPATNSSSAKGNSNAANWFSFCFGSKDAAEEEHDYRVESPRPR